MLRDVKSFMIFDRTEMIDFLRGHIEHNCWMRSMMGNANRQISRTLVL